MLRRRPRVPPRKGRKPLPQFGAGLPWVDDVQLRAINELLRLTGEQRGGRLTPRLMTATDPRRHGIFPKRGQRGEGIFSRMASKLAGSMAAKAAGRVAKTMDKRAAKKLEIETANMTKQVAKKVAKKAAVGAVAGAAGWGATKALDKI